MKLLLDTHLLLWAAGQPEKLSPAALTLIEAPENQPVFSAASLWEIAIKSNLGREDFVVEPKLIRRGLLDNDYEEPWCDRASLSGINGEGIAGGRLSSYAALPYSGRIG